MNIIRAQNLACPIDGELLEQTDNQLVCKNGHTYDISRQGYVNLLPVQFKRSKEPGDSKAMVAARRQFLDSGAYQPISSFLNELVSEQIINDKAVCILDAGCGDGYYCVSLTDSLTASSAEPDVCFIGVDISKDAIIQSTKRDKSISWVVGTNRELPVLRESVGIIICMFGFLNVEAFRKVLKPDGIMILVDPGSHHLKELREIIYPEINENEAGVADKMIPGFSPLKSHSIKYEHKLSSNELINSLLLMTPHFYRASKTGREEAAKLQDLDITVDVRFRLFQKLT